MSAKLTFDDEFNSLSVWNGATNTGTWSTNFWYNDQWGNYAKSNGSTLSGNGEQQWYINANYAPTSAVKPWSASDGVLTITAQPADASIKGLINNAQYTSGMINSWHSFSQQYGYFEIKADLPAGQGLWPAFWLMPEDGAWPPELDVFEVLGNDPDKLYTTAHSNASGSHTMATKGTDVADTSAGFHTYGVDWEADKITFYFDGKEVYETATPADMHKPMYMIANLAVGGSWPGNPDSSTPWPAQMKIDYIRAWDSNPYADDDPSTGGGGAPTAVSPAAANGLDGTAGADVIAGQASSDNRIRGLAGDDQITGGTAFNNINGNTGADTIVGKSTVGDWLLGGQGSDLIDASASGGRNIVNGNLGDDRILGGIGGDTLRGGQGDDTIIGGSGADWISGDRGSDVVTGGGGADTFHSWGGAGTMVVTDFSQAQGDRVMIAAGASHTETQQGADVLVDVAGGAKVFLQNTQLSALSDGWIV
jgi:beta-glucanase (GH16 family)